MAKGLIEKAHGLCALKGQKLTPIRHKILSLLLQANRPLTAYELLDLYREGQTSGTQPPTIYRALAFLEQAGLIHRLASTRQYVACDHLGAEHPAGFAQFFICDACGHLHETLLSDAIWQAIETQAKQHHFQVKQPNLEIHGLCEKCQTQSD